jgi:hypothetical protein
VVLDCLNHHFVLERRGGHLHAPRPSDGGVGNVAVAADFVRRIDDDHTLGLSEHPGGLAQHRRFADTRPAQEQDALSRFDNIAYDFDRSIHGASNPAGQSHDFALTVTDAGNAVERSGNARPVIVRKLADSRNDVLNIVVIYFSRIESDRLIYKACLWSASQIEYNLEQIRISMELAKMGLHVSRQNIQQGFQTVGY